MARQSGSGRRAIAAGEPLLRARLPAGSALIVAALLLTPTDARAYICGNAGAGGQSATDGGSSLNTACGQNADASGDWPGFGSGNTAIGVSANASGDTSRNTAIGDVANASGSGSDNVAAGHGANASGYNSWNTATGYFATAFGDNSINSAVGALANASGNESWNSAIGYRAYAFGESGVNIATGAQADASGTGGSNIATGWQARAYGNDSRNVAIGWQADAHGANTMNTAVGASAAATGLNASAFGSNSSATHANAVALGAGSVTSAADTVSVGSADNRRRITNVADGVAASDAVTMGQLSGLGVGLVQQAGSGLQITVGATTDGALGNVAGTAGPRRLTGLLAGDLSAASTDAVTGAQIFTANQRVAAAFGTVLDGNGNLVAPSYAIQGGAFDNVGSALGALDAQVVTNANDIVALDTRVTANTNDIGALHGQIVGGSIGLVQQDAATRAISVGATTDGALVNVAGTAGPRRLTGLLAGDLSAASTDAVTGAQLHTTNQQIASVSGNAAANLSHLAAALGGGAGVDGNGMLTAPGYSVQGGTFDNVGNALGVLDNQVTTNTASIVALNTTVSGLATGNSTYVKINSTGPAAQASGADAIAFGPGARASAADAVAVGNNAQATGANAIAIGAGAVATGSVAVGNQSQASNGGAAFGDGATATGQDSTAIGPAARATHANSAAFGNGAATTRANQQVYGTAGHTHTMPGVTSAQSRAAQSGPTQIVTSDNAGNLAAATLADLGLASGADIAAMNAQMAGFDARLDEVSGRAGKAITGVAMAFAMAGVPTLLPHETLAATLNMGTYQGAQGYAINAALRLAPNVQVNGGIGYGPDQKILGGRAGLRVGW